MNPLQAGKVKKMDRTTIRHIREILEDNLPSLMEENNLKFELGNATYDEGEYLADCNVNDKWDEGEYFIDEGDGTWSPSEVSLPKNKLKNQRYEIFIDSILKKIRGKNIPSSWRTR